MKYSELYHQAKQIDRLIDFHINQKGGLFVPQEELISLILQHFPYLCVENSGWHKVVFNFCSEENKVVLKVGAERSIESDHRAYKRVPHTIRHQFFARIFWHTKYCILQEYGSSAEVAVEDLECFKRAVYKYGVFDIKADNIRMINGQLKIIDANSTRLPVPTILRIIDELRSKIPKRLDFHLKKITKQFLTT